MEYGRETRLGIRAERVGLAAVLWELSGSSLPREGAAPVKGRRGGPGTQGVPLGDPIPPSPADQQLLRLQPGSPGPQDPPLSRAHRIRIYPPETYTTILWNQQKGVEPSFF